MRKFRIVPGVYQACAIQEKVVIGPFRWWRTIGEAGGLRIEYDTVEEAERAIAIMHEDNYKFYNERRKINSYITY